MSGQQPRRATRPHWLVLDPEWDVVARSGFGPFITREILRRADGTRVEWTSRRHRKGYPLRELTVGAEPRTAWQLWQLGAWLPRRIGWWISVLFMVGSALFALGAAPGFGVLTTGEAAALMFFAGSWFFTAAAFLQYLEAASTNPDPSGPQRWRVFVWAPQRPDWLSSLSQFLGTIAFNVTTGLALVRALTELDQLVVVWSPNAIGSILFLVSGYLAFAEVCHHAWRLRLGSRDWRLAFVNLLGCVFFGLSAIFAFVLPTDAELNQAFANLFTCLGGVCFLLGAAWLIPEQGEALTERRREATSAVPATAPAR
jgi:hypothetical protein